MLKAQNISARIVDSAAMTGEVRISRDLAIEMFGSPDVSPEVWRRLEGDGWYGIVRRDPNVNALELCSRQIQNRR